MVKLNRRVLGYCLAFICSAGVGALLQRIVASPQLRGGVPADGLVTTSLGGRMLLALDSVLPSPDGAVILNGRIDTQSMPLAGLPSEGWVSAVAVLMTASEWRSCEDLGRQLRELRREAAARGLQMVIWTDEKSFEAVQRELYRERISEVTLAAVDDLGSRVADAPIRTPAVVQIKPDGGLIVGVSFPKRHANVRRVPFAAALWRGRS